MFIEIIAFIMIIYFVSHIRQTRLQSIQLACQNELFALRDKVREKAIAKEIESDNWLFDYMDTSITKYIEMLPKFSLWVIVPLFFIDRRNTDYIRSKNILIDELKKPKNKALRNLHLEAVVIIGAYMAVRHKVIAFVVTFLIKIMRLIPRCIRLVVILKRKWQNLLRDATESPELSTLTKYI